MKLLTSCPEKDYQELNAAIMHALTSSEEVKRILMRFKEKDLVSGSEVLNLILGLDELYNLAVGPCEKEGSTVSAGEDYAPPGLDKQSFWSSMFSRNQPSFLKAISQEFSQNDELAESENYPMKKASNH